MEVRDGLIRGCRKAIGSRNDWNDAFAMNMTTQMVYCCKVELVMWYIYTMAMFVATFESYSSTQTSNVSEGGTRRKGEEGRGIISYDLYEYSDHIIRTCNNAHMPVCHAVCELRGYSYDR